jgi:Asp-tRNA(Asn)/Glu-tRNA(Gln) amidotransferase A subunit family amidase
MYFNPQPVNFRMPKLVEEPVWSPLPKTFTAIKNHDFTFYTIGQLSHLLKTRQITSVELTEFYLERLKQYDPILHCVVTLTENLAMQQAKRADREIANGQYRGPLHGIPYGAKDLLAVNNYPTTWGVSIYKKREIEDNATVIEKLEDAGAVLVAKLSLGELAMGDVWYKEKTRNPWNTNQGSSGSSAGSASAVSAGLLPFAIGSETYGSIVSPCYRCGVTGLRPTFGRVSRAGAMTLSWTLDKIGPICRTVEDCAIVFDAIQGADAKDRSTVNAPFNYKPKIEMNGLRVGYFKTKMEENYDNKIHDLETIKVLEKMGVDMVAIEEPDSPINPLILILNAESAASFDELTRTNQDDQLVQQDPDDWANIFRSARFIPAVEYIQANRIRSMLIEEMDEIMKQVDVIVTPPFKGNNLLLTNLTGHPCVVLPNGFDRDGEPAAITFIGHLYDEARLLAVAKAYQDVTTHHLKHPKMDK